MVVETVNKLSYKQAKLTVVVAFALGLLLSIVQIIFDFKNEQTRVDATVMQVLNTVRDSAAQAAYGLDTHLAARVISGLFEYEPIVRADITLDLGGEIATTDLSNSQPERNWFIERFFDDENRIYSVDLLIEGHTEPVGVLTVWVHPHLALQGFFNRIGVILLLGIFRSLVLAAILMALFYFLLTKRVIRITEAVSEFDPTNPIDKLVDVPERHKQDELDVLADAFNRYLQANKRHFADLSESENLRRRSEQRFRDFAEASSDWFWETDFEGRIVWESGGALPVINRPFDEVRNMTRQEIAGDLASKTDWTAYQKALRDHLNISGFEYSYRVKEGDTRSAEIGGVPLFSSTGEYLGHRGAASDITERKQAEAALQTALSDTERASQAKTEFLATMSHEFRTPLNAILGFSEILRAQYFGPLGALNYTEYANDIHESGEHMLALVNDVLDISAIEAGKRVIVKEEIHLQELLMDCLKKVDATIRSSDLVVSRHIPEDLPMLYADKRSVTQIFLNIISNAIKFTNPKGSICVTVHAADTEILIEVTDTGVGIPADKLQIVTEPFSQADSDPHKAHEGTGLGLSIVKALIDTHQGQLNIKSTEGEGTTVTVMFPLRQTNAA